MKFRATRRTAAAWWKIVTGILLLVAPRAFGQIVLRDSLNNGTLGVRTGGRFVAGGGWQVTGVADMLVYDLGRYLEDGSCELAIRNFQATRQNTFSRHHLFSMFRAPWGNHHPVENQETVWDLHAGTSYTPGVKMLSWTYDHNDVNTIVRDDWDPVRTYQIKVTWSGKALQYFRDNALYATHTHSAAMQLRYLYLGRDLTVSADLVTNFKNNQYPAVIGPIYSNIVVKENIPVGDVQPPQIAKITTSAIYANAARLTWATDEPSVCAVEYGVTTAYGERTPVLGPPDKTFSTALANLTPNQIYHYRLTALDDAGHLTTSSDQTFTTLSGGVYLFKPVADTYVEPAGLYGTRRDYGNFGWMNLLSGAGRECYWRFNVTGLHNSVVRAALRLHGRQTGNSGGTLRVLNASWEENEVTWRTKPNVNGSALGAINSVQAGQWHEVGVTAAVVGNGAYDLALIGAGTEVVSFDSRESTNAQPELIVTTGKDDRTAVVTPPHTTLFPAGFALYPNYPNPLRVSAAPRETRIVYELSARSRVKLALYDFLGREIKILADDERDIGTHTIRWNGRDGQGNLLPAGIYIYSLQTAGFKIFQKLLLVK